MAQSSGSTRISFLRFSPCFTKTRLERHGSSRSGDSDDDRDGDCDEGGDGDCDGGGDGDCDGGWARTMAVLVISGSCSSKHLSGRRVSPEMTAMMPSISSALASCVYIYIYI